MLIGWADAFVFPVRHSEGFTVNELQELTAVFMEQQQQGLQTGKVTDEKFLGRIGRVSDGLGFAFHEFSSAGFLRYF